MRRSFCSFRGGEKYCKRQNGPCSFSTHTITYPGFKYNNFKDISPRICEEIYKTTRYELLKRLTWCFTEARHFLLVEPDPPNSTGVLSDKVHSMNAVCEKLHKTTVCQNMRSFSKYVPTRTQAFLCSAGTVDKVLQKSIV